MPRPLRFIPQGGALVEVTVRTFQSRYLLRPGPNLNEIIGGVLGRAQARQPVRCHAAVFMSNHFHLLLSVNDARQLADFMEFLNSNLAREVNRLHEWQGDVWEQRYRAILVSTEVAAQIDRLRYLLSHGVKEGLVAHARDWPGVHCVREILAGEPIRGLWFNRTAESAARSRGENFGRLDYASEEVFELSPLPCWAHLSPEAYRQNVATQIAEVEAEAATQLERSCRVPLGIASILRQDPQTRPNWTKKSPAPMFHAATQAVRKAMRATYSRFVAAFRYAARRLKDGDRTVRFPVGSFPPALPFATADALDPPWY